MQDILLSKKQYDAILERLNNINEDVTSIKLMAGPETGYFDNWDLMNLLQVSVRTMQRWRKNGQLPFTKIGKRYYYKAETILQNFKVKIDEPAEEAPTHFETNDHDEADLPANCLQCPLFLILNS